MDPFEEFEFKPITEGLGFHKKKSDMKKQTESISLSEDLVRQTDLPGEVPDGLLEESLKKPRNQAEAYKDLMKTLRRDVEPEDLAARNQSVEDDLDLSEPLPRRTDSQRYSAEMNLEVELPDIKQEEIVPMSDMPDIIDGPTSAEPSFEDKKNALIDTAAVRRGATNSPKSKLVKAPVSFAAAILDFVLVIALAGMFLVSLLLITKVELQSVYFNFQTDMFTRASLGVLLIAVMQMYVVVARSFFGRTLGEWTFDYQMGNDKDIEATLYPIKIVWRSLVTVLTGLLLLPILSFIFQTDIAAKLTGVQLYKQQ